MKKLEEIKNAHNETTTPLTWNRIQQQQNTTTTTHTSVTNTTQQTHTNMMSPNIAGYDQTSEGYAPNVSNWDTARGLEQKYDQMDPKELRDMLIKMVEK